MESDSLNVIWNNPNTKKRFVIGKLTSGNVYKFEYSDEFNDAVKNGMECIQAFPEKKEYISEVLFPVFSSRLPDKRRKDINKILCKYGLKKYDGFELLKKSGGKLPIDNFEFAAKI